MERSNGPRTFPLDGSIPYTILQNFLTTDEEISDAEFRTLVVMMTFDFCNIKPNPETGVMELCSKGYCEASIARLALLRNTTPKSITRHLKRLTELGYIKNEQRGRKDGDAITRLPTRRWLSFETTWERKESEYEDKWFKASTKEGQICQGEETNSSNNAMMDVFGSTPCDKNVEQNIQRVKQTNIDSSACVDNPYDNDDFGAVENPSFNNSPEQTLITRGPSGEDLSDIDPSFLVGSTIPSEPIKVKGVQAKIKAGAYDKITAKDLLTYFNEKFFQVYHIPNLQKQSAQTYAIINSTLLKRYGARKAITYIDAAFDLWDKIQTDLIKYPRPSLVSLTQSWIIDRIDTALGYTQKLVQKETEYMGTDTSSAYEPVKETSDDNPYIKGSHPTFDPAHRPYDHWGWDILCTLGYVNVDMYDLYHKVEPDHLKKYIEEEVIPEWNRNNPTLTM